MSKLQDRCLDCGASRRVYGDGGRSDWVEETKEQKWCDHTDIVNEDVEPVEHDRDWSNYEQ